MKKILILQDMPLFPYRIYAYNELIKRNYDLTVVSVSNKKEDFNIKLDFKSIVLSFKKYGPFVKLNNPSTIKDSDYDIIIVDPNLRMLDYYFFYRSKYWKKLIGWGHHKGRTTGNKFAEWFRFWFFKKFHALVFYESQTRDEYIEHGFNPERLFVANNTQYVNVETVNLAEKRCYFTYVGRIQERKQVDMAIEAFAILKTKIKDESLKFLVVGGGNVTRLKQIAIDNHLERDVIFVGEEHNERKLGEYFNHSYAYVSPGHVGLGVLHALAFGVPVITCKDRKHSLEIVNCKPENSFLVDFNSESVAEAMYKLYSDQALWNRMSQSAYDYYQQNCTIDKMVDGVDDAIKYICEKK